MRLLAMLGHWADGNGPLYRRLAEAITGAVERGDLAPESRLPAERNLAEALAISRSTVVATYDRLADVGLVERRQGSGSYVRRPAGAPNGATAEQLTAALDANTIFRGLIAGPGETIDFSLAAPLPAPAVQEALRRLADVIPDVRALGRGYVLPGFPAFRSAIAEYLSEMGLPTSERQVLVTTGGQQAINLAAMLCLGPGDAVVVENPTYHGALDAFRSARARLVSVPVDAQGPRIDLLQDLLSRTSPRLVYVSSSFNNPTGALMSHPRRRELALLARGFQIPVVEDLVLGEVPLSSEPMPPPIASLDEDGWVMTVGSMSKLFWGGLRVGWIRATEQTIFRLAQLKAAADLGTSLLAQIVSIDLLHHASEVRAWRRAEAQQQLKHLSATLEAHLPSWTWDPPAGGNDLWVKLPQGNASDFLQVAARYGVTAAAGPLFSADGGFADRLRLTFLLDPEDVDEGVRRLAEAWQAYLPRSGHPAREMAAIV